MWNVVEIVKQYQMLGISNKEDIIEISSFVGC